MTQQSLTHFHHSGAEFLTRETKGLYEPHGSKALAAASEKSAHGNLNVCWSIEDWPKWRQLAHDVKAYTVAHLDLLLDRFVRNLEAKGVTVYWAKDAEEANRIVLDIAKKHEVKTVVKGKSMVSEEMELNHFLASHGITALETDLGEYIVQLARQRPTHIVTPALHLSAAEIGHLFEEKLGEKFTDVHEELTRIARKRLREKFITADMGISGINFGIADTGSFCLVENEGNIGLSTSAPPVHVALMGIEKLIPKLEYLPLFLNMLPRMGTGQKLTSYTHLFNGPTQGRKMYVILMDNGRTGILQQPEYRTMLHCIRCGLCLNHCPVYRQVGGWAYGWVYPGPMGTILTSNLVGIEKASSLPFASSLCGACSEICPVKVDLAHMLVRLRKKAIDKGTKARTLLDRMIWKSYAMAMQGNFRFKSLMFAIKTGMRIIKFLPWHPDKLGQWTRGRALPKIPQEPAFRDWWEKNRKNQKKNES
ncbi:MAG: lactate utilization protein [Planctomycetaceae bacterium]|jgi:L-lactate dehydrogenase complex protein LldF|nr:lactate utilization protein [Planctomycetaceae bacterium]